MTCRDFKRLINEQLDAREAACPDVERALESHGSACRAEALRYHMVRQAIAAVGAPPAPPADFVERFLRHWEHAGTEVEEAVPPRILALWPVALPLAAAAAVLLAVVLGVRSVSPVR